ncbi:MAG: molybdopterin molybdotransferase MoeA [Armatimonadetes bacterium]|nr:molybdopterin molybdotransferase MoeA [Armatimonadota bacterium]
MQPPLPVDQALAIVLAHCRRLPGEAVPLAACRGRVLAEDVVSDLDLPLFTNSAMDGFAVHASDLAEATEQRPVWLPVTADLPAGPSEPGPLMLGTTARIMTGAELPPGADAVVPIELAHVAGGRVHFATAPRPGANVRPRGEDVRIGETVLRAGTTLGYAEIAVLAALGRVEVPVTRAPRAAVLSTGDELVDVSEVPGPGQLRDSSILALPAQLAALGVDVVGAWRAVDNEEALVSRLQGLPNVDLVITAGGVSMGDRDFVRPVAERLGEVYFHRVAIKPGKPLVFGRLGEALFFGLPGNPVSSMVSVDVFVRPAVDALLGRSDGGRLRLRGRMAEAVRSDASRCEYVRVTVRADADGQVWATATGDQGSGRMASMLGADGYAIIPEGVAVAAAGEEVRIELF